MSHSRTTLSPLERLDLIFSLLKTISTAIITLLSVPFLGTNGHLKAKKHVIHTALRVMNSRASAKQIQFISASTDEAYTTFAEANNFNPISTNLPEDATAHWIGSPTARRILVFFHGGGFVFPAKTQFQFIYDVQQKAGDDTAGVVLSYSLAPTKSYPHQLRQAVALISYLINEAGRKPEDIVLVGDSAGANLLLAVVSHVLHPHPDKSIPVLEIDSPFKGALLVSPWVDFSAAAASYTMNGKRDVVDRHILIKWGNYFMGRATVDAYNQPGTASTEWWHGIDAKVRNLAVIYGDGEVMFDDIKKFNETLKESFPNLEVQLMKGETHDQPFLDPLTGEKEESDSTRISKSWILDRL